MKKRISFFLALFFVCIATISKADEGMWLPLFIKRLNYEDMQKKGLKLTAEELYSINNSSLKDAIVSLGGFCTAEVISQEGLLLTNHHCAFDLIQSHSSPEKDYLTNGFWAMSRDQELPNPGLFVNFLVRIEDVTARVTQELGGLQEPLRKAKAMEVGKKIAEEAVKGSHYNAVVKDFFHGNEFYLFVLETFTDVRLVGAPPSSIGKFGGDTDNWMWPRHTGDFSLLRVYAGADGKPAPYSASNVPYKPKHSLPISMRGIKEGDFSMTFGYPGRTQRYRVSEALKMDYDISNPTRVALRETRLNTWKADMNKSDKVRIQYAGKHAYIANYWKFFMGENRGLKRLGTIQQREKEEAVYQEWANKNGSEEQKQALTRMKEAIAKMRKVEKTRQSYNEGVLGIEIFEFSSQILPLTKPEAAALLNDPELIKELKATGELHFKDYNVSTDQKLFVALMKMYAENVPADQRPAVTNAILAKGNLEKVAAGIYSKSIFTDKARYMAFWDKPDLKKLLKDPALVFLKPISDYHSQNIMSEFMAGQAMLEDAMRHYAAGLKVLYPDKKFYPDANSTMRMSYGTVRAYDPADGTSYKHITTIDGIIEKEDPQNEEFIVPAKLKELYAAKDYGVYGENGTLITCFISDNDITGGNSGSPVINGKGELIGLAFDGNWESMNGNLVYDPKLKRCINADIRYVLFVIDKMCGAGHLVKEMKLVN
ncbi:MAG: S46 family peptidase [Cytophagales bacterium]|nr:MAG: S46 family peptidase [Cytophagales bacterium]TAF59941.1 MAG: S46 family peptidase [Cytophagales bacterium]